MRTRIITKESLIGLVSELLIENRAFDMTLMVPDEKGEKEPQIYGLLSISPFSDYAIDYLMFGSYEQNGQRKCMAVDHTNNITKEQLTDMFIMLPECVIIQLNDEV